MASPVGSVPYINLDEKLYFQSYPILRHFARKLGKYDGKTDEEKYFADVRRPSLLPFCS